MVIEGLQGRKLDDPTSIMATAKHFIGDGGTTGGDDQGNTQISLDELRRIHLPPFRAAVDHGVGSVMISFNSWNGVKDHGNKFLITDLLKGELRFSGFVISDWNGIDQIDGQEGFTAAEVKRAVNAGIDMVMVPDDYQKFVATLKAEVLNGRRPDVPHRRRQPADPHQEVRARPVRAPVHRPLATAGLSAARRTAPWRARRCASRRCC